MENVNFYTVICILYSQYLYLFYIDKCAKWKSLQTFYSHVVGSCKVRKVKLVNYVIVPSLGWLYDYIFIHLVIWLYIHSVDYKIILSFSWLIIIDSFSWLYDYTFIQLIIRLYTHSVGYYHTTFTVVRYWLQSPHSGYLCIFKFWTWFGKMSGTKANKTFCKCWSFIINTFF